MAANNGADEQRLVHLYYYLCACLARQQRAGGDANASAIAERLGNRDLRKIIGPLLQEDLTWDAKAKLLGKLSKSTTGSVVELLHNLNQSLQQDYRNHEESYLRVLSLEDTLTVLYQLIDLTPDERQALNLPAGDGLTLLQRALTILQTTGGLDNHEMIFQVYKAAVGLNSTHAEKPLDNLAQAYALVAQVVQKALDYLPDRPPKGRVGDKEYCPSRSETVNTLTQKAQREIRRLLARSGNQVSPSLNSNVAVNSYVQQYLRPTFVTKLAQTVVSNERLTDQFPVYLKRLSFQPCGPLPFADKDLDILNQSDGPYPPLLHPALRNLDATSNGTSGFSEPRAPGDYELAAQEATLIVAEFYVKVPDHYEPAVTKVFQQLTNENQNQRRIDFSLQSTGIGGTLSHVIKVINSALFQDIPCLREYFPIGHDIISTQTIIQDDVGSPVWAHSLVKLCRKATISQTLQSTQPAQLGIYEERSFADPMGHGDYCGFDFMLSQAQSALHARLQAIRNLGVLPNTYIQDLCQRTERLIALESAWNCLRGYPFSTLAMIGLIHEDILPPHFQQIPLKKTDPYIYFDACLSIVEAMLDEGLYRPSRQYLKRLEVLDEFVEQGFTVHQPETATFEVFSGALIIRYLLCLANYCYLYDTEDRAGNYLPPHCHQNNLSRDTLVRQAWETLEQAQRHVQIRLAKYIAINEISQSTFSPHYLLLGRIAYLRAKLMLFFPRLVPNDQDYLPTDNPFRRDRTEASIHWGRLYLLEKARLYAAADGNSEIYACYAAMQCWAHLIAAYTDARNLDLRSSGVPNTGQLAPSDCFEWARKLRDHALISYAETGRQCYYQIKEKSGLPKENIDSFGHYFIEKIPAIYEIRSEEQIPFEDTPNLLVLDISLLAVEAKTLPKLSAKHPDRNIYLFGSTACYLFFARGLFMLCSNEAEEFKPSASAQIDWDAKLQHATRLFNVAWAIAEDGCEIQSSKEQGKRLFHISRSLKRSEQHAYSPPEVHSVRDLYPRRITELADLGKIFAAACIVLRMSLVSAEMRAVLAQDVESLLKQLHGQNILNQSRTLKALINRQTRYNGHLKNYLQNAKKCILQYQATASDHQNIEAVRNHLVSTLFSLLQERPE